MVWVPGMGGIVWCGDPAGINIGSCVETVTERSKFNSQDEEEDGQLLLAAGQWPPRSYLGQCSCSQFQIF